MRPQIPELQQFEEDTPENRLKYTFFVVEADSFARQEFWSRHSGQSIVGYIRKGDSKQAYGKVNWEQINDGWLVEVGKDHKRPVCISVTWARIDGKLVMFWYPTSQIVNHTIINKWLKKHFKGKWDDDRREAFCDASNFHHCLDAIEEAN